MSSRYITWLKVVVHLLCLAPLLWLLHIYRDATLATYDDPVKYITHFTGNWALWLLLGDLAITPARRLNRSLNFLIRFRRMIGLYAFFYATLHLATYVFLYSGYDAQIAFAGLKAGHPGEFWTQLKLVWPTMWEDAQKRKFIQVGFLAWLILLALAVTSSTAVLQFMGGKNWQRLHRLIYLAAYLGVVHYWWQLKKDTAPPVKLTIIFFVLLLARLVFWLMKKVSAKRNLQRGRSA